MLNSGLLLRNLAEAMAKLDSIWSGVYRSFAESGGDDTVFEGDLWLERATETANTNVRQSVPDQDNLIPRLSVTHDFILPVVTTMVQAYTRHLKILDFGGGIANSFLQTIAGLEDSGSLEFHIVEGPRSCEAGEALLSDDTRVHFHTALPELDDVNIVHIGSALQYIEDWRGLLGKLREYDPDVFVLAHLHAGDIPESFVTLQHYYGREIPCWFWKLDDIIRHMDTLGYRPGFKARHLAKILGEIGPLPMAALPEEYRMEDFCQMIFVRKNLGSGE